MLNKIPKIVLKVFLVVAIIQLLCVVALVFLPNPASAQDIRFKPQVNIGDFQAGVENDPKADPKLLGKYIAAVYKWGTGFVGILAAVVLMFGGVSWIMAMGNAERIGNAKAWIGAALTGLVLAMSSYMILQIINPELVKIHPINVPSVKAFGCCEKPKESKGCGMTTQEKCESGWGGTEYSCDYKTNKCIRSLGCCAWGSPSLAANTACILNGCSPYAQCANVASPEQCNQVSGGSNKYSPADACVPLYLNYLIVGGTCIKPEN
ncbi:pilin [Patescibacteria group bacterium]